MSARGSRRDTPALWAVATLPVAASIGVLAAAGGVKAALAPMVLAAVIALAARPDWLPVLLVVTMFAEAVDIGGLTLSRAVGPLAILILVLRVVTIGASRMPDKRIIFAIIGYGGWALTSLLWTVDPNFTVSDGSGKQLSALALSAAFTASAAVLITTRAELLRVLWAIWTMSVLMGLIAIAEFLTGSARAVGASGDANFFAALEVLSLPLGAVLASHVDRTRLRTIVLLGLAVAVGSILTSLSRGGILALAAVFLLLSVQPARGFFRTRARKTVLLASTLVGVCVLLVASYSALSARTSSLFNTADGGSGRSNLWRAAIVEFDKHPIHGIGYGAFPGVSNQVLLETPGVDFSAYKLRAGGQVVHSAYLGSLAELGLVGLTLFVLFLVSIALSLRAAARRAAVKDDLFVSAVARGLVLSVTAFALTSLFLSSETNRAIWVVAGVALAVARISREEPVARPRPPDPLVRFPRSRALPPVPAGTSF